MRTTGPVSYTHLPQLYKEGTEEKIEKDLKEMKANGIETVVDATPVGLGRDVRGLKRASQRTGVNIICLLYTSEYPYEPALERVGGYDNREN